MAGFDRIYVWIGHWSSPFEFACALFRSSHYLFQEERFHVYVVWHNGNISGYLLICDLTRYYKMDTGLVAPLMV